RKRFPVPRSARVATDGVLVAFPLPAGPAHVELEPVVKTSLVEDQIVLEEPCTLATLVVAQVQRLLTRGLPEVVGNRPEKGIDPLPCSRRDHRDPRIACRRVGCRSGLLGREKVDLVPDLAQALLVIGIDPEF